MAGMASPDKVSSRQRMVDSTISLLRESSAGSVTVDAVLDHSGAPRGSVYYHFPGGRDELLLTAVREAGESIVKLMDRAAKEGDPLGSLKLFVAMWKRILARSDYRAGCAVVAQAIDNRDDLPEIGQEVREIFTRWEATFTDLLVANNTPSERARRLSTLTIASIEGAVILCRVHRSPQPLDDVLTELAPLFGEPSLDLSPEA